MFYSELSSVQRRVAHARPASDLYFAALIPKQSINEDFGETRGILDRAQIYVTSVTVWGFFS